MLLLSRTIHFNAAHRLHNPRRSEDWNYKVYGPGANAAGYGHNYALDVAIAGSPDPDTGMIVNLTDLDRILKDEVDKPLDHRNLNCEVKEFAETVPTAENVALWIWRRLETRIEREGWRCSLVSLVLRVTPNFAVELVAPALAEADGTGP